MMDARLKALLAEPDDDHVFTVTKDTHLPVRLSAEVVAENVEQAIDIARHDLTEWKIESVAGNRVQVTEMRRIIGTHERAMARLEVDQWRRTAWCFFVMWSIEFLLPRILQVLR